MDGQSNNPPLKSERCKKIVELRHSGFTARQIAQALDMDYNVLSATLAMLRKRGYIPRIPQNEAINRQKASRDKKHIHPDLIIGLNNQGFSQQKIAEQTGQPLNYIKTVLKNRRGQKAEEFRLKVIELYNLNISYSEMAKQLNSSLGHLAITVRRLVEKGRLKYRMKDAHT